jgi:hypothetical protein
MTIVGKGPQEDPVDHAFFAVCAVVLMIVALVPLIMTRKDKDFGSILKIAWVLICLLSAIVAVWQGIEALIDLAKAVLH